MQWFTNTCPLNYDCTRKHKCFIWKGITPFTEVAFLLWPPIFAEAWTPSRAGWACWTGPCLYRPWWHWSTSGGARISRRSEFQKVFKTKPSPGDCWGAWPCGPQCWRRGWHTGWWRSWWPRPPPAGPETRPAAQQPDIRAKLTIWAPGCLSCQYSVNFTQSSNKLILETLFHDMKYWPRTVEQKSSPPQVVLLAVLLHLARGHHWGWACRCHPCCIFRSADKVKILFPALNKIFPRLSPWRLVLWIEKTDPLVLRSRDRDLSETRWSGPGQSYCTARPCRAQPEQEACHVRPPGAWSAHYRCSHLLSVEGMILGVFTQWRNAVKSPSHRECLENLNWTPFCSSPVHNL